MKIGVKAKFLSLVLLSAILLTACPKRTSIADIESNPSKFQDKDVAVAGTVRDGYGGSLPILNVGGGIYKVDDGTGSIWVLTRKSVPAKGAQIGVKGKVQNIGTFNGKSYGLGIIEDDRKFKGK